MSLVQIKHTYPYLAALLWLNTDGWSSQKCFPAALLLSAILWSCTNHLKTPANMPSLTGIGMNLDQVKYTYLCLTAFIMTEHWLKHSKMVTSHLHLLSAKNEGAPTTTKLSKNAFHDWCKNELGSNKTYISMFYIFYYDWTLAEAARNSALPHCCWVPKMKVLQPPQNFMHINLPWLV